VLSQWRTATIATRPGAGGVGRARPIVLGRAIWVVVRGAELCVDGDRSGLGTNRRRSGAGSWGGSRPCVAALVRSV